MSVNRRLLENGDLRLLEDSYYRLLEDSTPEPPTPGTSGGSTSLSYRGRIVEQERRSRRDSRVPFSPAGTYHWGGR